MMPPQAQVPPSNLNMNMNMAAAAMMQNKNNPMGQQQPTVGQQPPPPPLMGQQQPGRVMNSYDMRDEFNKKVGRRFQSKKKPKNTQS
jgi:hypothetical protein